ncbi:hypothetical protein CC80DRAFT_549440 [Byssothecium circinans]|uniref:Peptidase A1 domain-containing protein n=1 Tax=Byssothecium circinans TaxID=147558 RepID=A0A6A5TUA4_9PLEO|nr:hypothetical protein CC80DRAFT_549440 [Byssothecium circinans]
MHSSSLIPFSISLLSTIPTTLVLAAKCAAPALNLPYRNISTTPGTLHHGIPIHIGSPWQIIALIPSLQLDNTFIPRFTNTCVHDDGMRMRKRKRSLSLQRRDGHPGAWEEDNGRAQGNNTDTNAKEWEAGNWWVKCGEVYGGSYTPKLSGSFRDLGPSTNGKEEWWFKRQKYDAFRVISEKFLFTDYADVYSTSFEALPPKRNITSSFLLANEGASFGGLGASMLGLGPNSTLLKQLLDEKMIASTSWSLTKDTLCLGCEDATARTGNLLTIPASDRDKDAKLPCSLQTKIEALNWHPKKGVEGASLIETPFTACIDPGVQFLVLPHDARGVLKKVLDRDVKAEYEDYISLSGPPKTDVGVLTFRLEGGLEVNVSVAGVGRVNAAETSTGAVWNVPVGKGRWGAYGNATWVLGRPFTDAVVLRWDAGKKEYGLAARNEDGARKSDIKPLGCDEFPGVQRIVTVSPGTGVVVGAVVAGVLGGLVFAGVGMVFYKRGRRGGGAGAGAGAGGGGKYEVLPGGTAPRDTHSIHMDTVPMHSVPSSDSRFNSWTSGTVSPPPASVYSGFSGHNGYGAGGMGMGLSFGENRTWGGMGKGGQHQRGLSEVDDATAIHEAPEGGTAVPTKRERAEMYGPPIR